MAVSTQDGQIAKGRFPLAVLATQRLAMVYLAEILHGGAEDLFEVEVTGFAAELSSVGLYLTFLTPDQGSITFSSEVAVPLLLALSAGHQDTIVDVGELLAVS